MEKEVIETRTAKLWFGEDGIIYQKILPQAKIALEDVKENFEISKKLGEKNHSEKLLFLTNGRHVKSIDREARHYSSSNEVVEHTLTLAAIICSPLGRAIGNLSIGINKPLFPTRLFTSEDKAIERLKGFIEKSNDGGKK